MQKNEVGRIMTVDDAIKFFQLCLQKEAVTEAERLAILEQFGKPVHKERFEAMLENKKCLYVKGRKNARKA